MNKPVPKSYPLSTRQSATRSDGHRVVQRDVALRLEVVEVRAHLRRELDALDDGERAEARPQVDVVVRDAALGAAVGAADERLELEQRLVELGEELRRLAEGL